MTGRDLKTILTAAGAVAVLATVFLAYRGPDLAMAMDLWSLCF